MLGARAPLLAEEAAEAQAKARSATSLISEDPSIASE